MQARALMRRLTPKKALGAVADGGVFGGGHLFLGDGPHQESMKARTLIPVPSLFRVTIVKLRCV